MKVRRSIVLSYLPEGSFCIDEKALALGAAIVDWKLTGDSKCVAQLGLAFKN